MNRFIAWLKIINSEQQWVLNFMPYLSGANSTVEDLHNNYFNLIVWYKNEEFDLKQFNFK